jgi:hypothetical protein
MGRDLAFGALKNLYLSIALSFLCVSPILIVSLGLRCLELSPVPWVRANEQGYSSRRGIGLSQSD